jgi:hypothetical protein
MKTITPTPVIPYAIAIAVTAVEVSPNSLKNRAARMTAMKMPIRRD